MPSEELSKKIVYALNQANKRSSTSANADVLNQAYKDILIELTNKYKALGIEEVEHAIRIGSLGYLGEFYGVNSKSVIGWLEEYKTRLRNEALKIRAEIQNKLKESEKMEAEKKTKEKFHADMVKFYNSGEIGMIPKFVAYQYLAETLGHDLLSKKDKLEIWEKAKEIRKREFHQERDEAVKKGDRNGVTQLSSLIEDLPINYVKSKAQELALDPLVAEMKKQKIELK